MEILEQIASNPVLVLNCYTSDNNFAYHYDLGGEHKLRDIKIYNFVPTYDKWCLACAAKNAHLRCSKCKSVHFCSKQCQKKAWQIHKKHCGRDLFALCCCCGKGKNDAWKCDNCPVHYCSDICKNKFQSAHKEFDCDYFSQTFNK